MGGNRGINTVGVVGAGVIGRSVAQDLAQTKHHVILTDVSDAQLDRARTEIATAARLHHMVARTGEALDPGVVLDRITFTTDPQLLAAVGFLIENTTESWEVKSGVYAAIDSICPDDCVFGVNTSAIPIRRIAALTTRPDRVVGIHFMNPVPLKPVVEVVRSSQTSDATLDQTRALLAQMNKEAIVVGDGPGFVANRTLMLTINEAAATVQDGIADAPTVDAVFRRCFNHASGPLETADLIGIDTIVRTLDVLEDEFGSDRYRACDLLRELNDEGKLGRKTGRGFYAYESHQARADRGGI